MFASYVHHAYASHGLHKYHDIVDYGNDKFSVRFAFACMQIVHIYGPHGVGMMANYLML